MTFFCARVVCYRAADSVPPGQDQVNTPHTEAELAALRRKARWHPVGWGLVAVPLRRLAARLSRFRYQPKPLFHRGQNLALIFRDVIRAVGATI